MIHTRYSWILPIKNEATSLPQLIDEIVNVMPAFGWEIIAVDDASTDETWKILTYLKKQYTQLKIVHFYSHRGKWAALFAGFNIARGRIIITSDSDLQDDPREVIKLLEKLNLGYHLVSGWRKIRFDPLYKVTISKIGNFLASGLTKKTYRDLNSSFKLYRREVIDNLPKHGSMLRFTMLFANRLGFRIAEVPINHRPRIYGVSRFGLLKYARILYDLILILLLFSGSGRIRKIK